MPLPKGPSGGLPQQPGGGLPPRQPGLPNPGQGNQLPRPTNPLRPQQEGPGLPEIPTQQPVRPQPSDPGFNGMERLQEYDFGAQQVDSSPLSQRGSNNSSDELDVPSWVDDEEESNLAQEVASRRERETAERFDRSMEERTPAGKVKNNALKAQAGELDENGQNVFIDKKNKKVEPFGGKKSALKVNDVDRRANLRRNSLIVQIVVIGLILVTLGFAVKNSFWPPASLTEADVQGIVYNTTGTTAFPLEQGRYFAESYMEAYLEYNPADPDSSAVMQYYNRGELASGGTVDGVTVGKNFSQEVAYGPIVYRSQAATANSAIYTIGALVKVSNTVETPAATDGATVTPVDDGALIWKYFSLNVYYDDEANAFAIAGTPIVVPNPDVLSSGDVPSAAPIGSGKAADEATVDAITPTIYGFLEAYRVSTAKDYSKLLPFLVADPEPALLNGLGELYDFKGGAADEASVVINAYSTATTSVKVIATVTWVQDVAGTSIETTSSYVIDVQPISGGFDVTRFLPLAYVPAS